MFENRAKDPASAGASWAYKYIHKTSKRLTSSKTEVFRINGQRIDSVHLDLHGSINATRRNAAE